MSKKILVIGGTGMLGEPVARQLHADGYAVRVFTRDADKARAQFGPEFDVAAGDVEDAAALASAMQGCYGVHINLNGSHDVELEARAAKVIAATAAKSGVQRFTYLSGASVCEENSWYPGTRAKLTAETALRASGVPYTIFRATFFIESLPRFVRNGRASVIGQQPHPYHFVAARDFARMVSNAYAQPGTASAIAYVYGPEALTLQAALQLYCDARHPGLRVSHLPLWLAGLFAAMSPELAASLPFFRYTEKVREGGDPAEANALFGAPVTTVQQWCKGNGAVSH